MPSLANLPFESRRDLMTPFTHTEGDQYHCAYVTYVYGMNREDEVSMILYLNRATQGCVVEVYQTEQRYRVEVNERLTTAALLRFLHLEGQIVYVGDDKMTEEQGETLIHDMPQILCVNVYSSNDVEAAAAEHMRQEEEEIMREREEEEEQEQDHEAWWNEEVWDENDEIRAQHDAAEWERYTEPMM
jgi:hypothetical protein